MKAKEIAHIQVDRMLTLRRPQMRLYLFQIGAITYRFTAFVPDIFKCVLVKNEHCRRSSWDPVANAMDASGFSLFLQGYGEH